MEPISPDQKESVDPPEISVQVRETIARADDILGGKFSDEKPPEDGIDPAESFSGLLLDLNDEALNSQDIVELEAWIERSLGSRPDKAEIKSKYLSPDGLTNLKIFEKQLGTEEFKWYISQWQNEGEKPSFILWSEEMYGDLPDMGFEEQELLEK